ncbi:hypothetical protein [Minisyncoccus archaeiphilus]|uniref:hypothetical protein n=1 Tax=Minisyncoccus archaeiphilus TaxID=3238481 RepID=UPI00399CA0D5
MIKIFILIACALLVILTGAIYESELYLSMSWQSFLMWLGILVCLFVLMIRSIVGVPSWYLVLRWFALILFPFLMVTYYESFLKCVDFYGQLLIITTPLISSILLTHGKDMRLGIISRVLYSVLVMIMLLSSSIFIVYMKVSPRGMVIYEVESMVKRIESYALEKGSYIGLKDDLYVNKSINGIRGSLYLYEKDICFFDRYINQKRHNDRDNDLKEMKTLFVSPDGLKWCFGLDLFESGEMICVDSTSYNGTGNACMEGHYSCR